MFEDPDLTREVLGLGTSAYIHKSAPVDELLAAPYATSQGAANQRVIMTMPRWKLEPSSQDRSAEVLSNREFEVLLLAARGYSNIQIAHHLNLAAATVKRHLANIYLKMEVSSRGEAVRKALENERLTIHQIISHIEE
jgi:DNA-binding NarL/FixJ family response regulator